MQGLTQLLAARTRRRARSSSAPHSMASDIRRHPDRRDLQNAHKLLLTHRLHRHCLGLCLGAPAIPQIVHRDAGRHALPILGEAGRQPDRRGIVTLGILSIWFDNPARLASVLGLIGAGVAFALQRVITAVAGYFVILRGKTFNVGDRILMGGVRGDVVGLRSCRPGSWKWASRRKRAGRRAVDVGKSRQFTGRIVTVTNDKVFDEPVYNYTPRVSVHLGRDSTSRCASQAIRRQVEKSFSSAARKHALSCEKVGEEEVGGSSKLRDRRWRNRSEQSSGGLPTIGSKSPFASSARIMASVGSRTR